MAEWTWNLEGTKVEHVLTHWEGIVIRGIKMGMMDAGDNFSVAVIRFVIWDVPGEIGYRCRYEDIDCIEAELKESE